MNFLSIQSTYDAIECAIFDNKTLIEQITIPKFQASAQLINKLQELLSTNNLSLTDISFIAVNQGPAPFTTLRVVISSVNGLSFARNIPLIGIDALDACAQEWSSSIDFPYVVLLNAFSNDVYYAIAQSDSLLETGCINIFLLIEKLKPLLGKSILHAAGNGALLHQNLIKKELDNVIIIESKQYCSIQQIGLMGYKKWKNGERGTNQLMPLYLKSNLG